MPGYRLEILPQPDDTTCGPTSLHAVYRHFGDLVPLEQVIEEVPGVTGGGTLGVHLGNHALERGYRATIYTYNLQLFDPTWFSAGYPSVDIRERLSRQLAGKDDHKFREATMAYQQFIELGGVLRYEDLDEELLMRHLSASEPILVGLSATYLYGSARELGNPPEFNDIRGEPAGHFVLLTGYDHASEKVRVADPLKSNPMGTGQYYRVAFPTLMGAIFLGVMTYDGNLLVIHKK
jgi:hypothetical protein